MGNQISTDIKLGVTKGVKTNKRDLSVCWHDPVHRWLGSATYVSSLMLECASDLKSQGGQKSAVQSNGSSRFCFLL